MTSAAGRDPRPDDARLLTAAQELRLTEWAYQPYATVIAPPPSQADVKALLADRAALAVRVAAVEARAANAEADAERLRIERDYAGERLHHLSPAVGLARLALRGGDAGQALADLDHGCASTRGLEEKYLAQLEALAGLVPAGGQDGARVEPPQ